VGISDARVSDFDTHTAWDDDANTCPAFYSTPAGRPVPARDAMNITVECAHKSRHQMKVARISPDPNCTHEGAHMMAG
jgi:hypothetical protein